MSALFLGSLVVIGLSPAIMRIRYGRQWMVRPYGTFVIMAVIYHGLAEILIRWTHAQVLVTYRVDQSYVDDGMFVAALSLLAMTIGYVIVAPPYPIARTSDVDDLKRAFDWRIFAVLAAPLFVATLHGKGYAIANGVVLKGQGINQQGLASQFFVPMIALTTFSFILRHPRRWIPAIFIQSVIMAAAGQRLEIVVAALTVSALAGRLEIKPSKKQVSVIAAIGLLGLLAISATRAQEGRGVFQSNSGFGARASALIYGLTHPTVQKVHGGTPLAELGLRLDSNSYSGGIMKAFESDRLEPLGWEGPQSSVITMLPSFMDPSKVADLQRLDYTPKNQARDQLGLAQVDYPEGAVNTYLGNFGPAMNIAFDLFIGVVLALLDIVVCRRVTTWRLVGYLLVLQSALFFERGIDQYLVTLRSFLVFAAGLWLFATISRALDPDEKWALTRSFRELAYPGSRTAAEGGASTAVAAPSLTASESRRG